VFVQAADWAIVMTQKYHPLPTTSALHIKKQDNLWIHIQAAHLQQKQCNIIMPILIAYGWRISHLFLNHYKFHQMWVQNFDKNIEIICISTFKFNVWLVTCLSRLRDLVYKQD